METKAVVVAYDFSESADLALARAVDLGCRAPNHVLHFLTVLDAHHGLHLEPDEVVDYRYAERVQELLATRLHALFAGRGADAEVHFFVHARIGQPTEEILGLAEEVGAELIIVGSHGRTGLRRLLLGSVSEAVARGARCAVMVARTAGYPQVQLETVTDAPADHHRARALAHRYTYVNGRAQTRPAEWPLY
jgi:nucleotide-binding universal stress UspA family protein